MGFAKGAGNVLLALFLALAWQWGSLLKDAGVIGDTGRWGILVAMAVVLVGQQTYLVLPKPMSGSVVGARRPLTETYLANLLGRYYNKLEELGVPEPFPVVRVNIMLVTKRWKGLLYTPQELSLTWRKKNGPPGWAWQNKHRALYDSAEEGLKSSADGLTKAQKDAGADRGSMLSEPILYEDNFVGALTMDSRDNIATTKFTDGQVITMAAEAAKIVAGQFDPKGVGRGGKDGEGNTGYQR